MIREYIAGFSLGPGTITLFIASCLLLLSDYAQGQNSTLVSAHIGALAASEDCSLALTISAQSPSCANLADGVIEIIPNDGTEPYTYDWNIGAAGKRIAELKAGEYHVRVTDANGCSSTETVLLLSPPPIKLVSDKSLPGCGDHESGSIALQVSGGNPPYLYNWAHGPQHSGLAGLQEGTYSVKVTDKRGCEEALEIDLQKAPEISIDNSRIRTVTTAGGNDGEIDLFVSGGRSPYTFLWLHNGVELPRIGQLEEGIYKVLIADATNCKQSFHFDLSYVPPTFASNASGFSGGFSTEDLAFRDSDVIVKLGNIYWDYGSRNLEPAASLELDRLSTLMNRYPEMIVEINSHTDSRSTAEYNMELSQDRADAVVDYLASKSISRDRMVAVGYGEYQLLNDCYDGVDCSEEEHLYNRRTAFKVTYFNEELNSSSQNGFSKMLELQSRLEAELMEMEVADDTEIIVLLPSERPPEKEHTLSRIRNVAEADPKASAAPAGNADKSVWWETGSAYGIYIGEETALAELNPESLRKIGPLQFEEREDGKIHFVLGYYTNLSEVKAAHKAVKDLGTPNTYVISYKDGKRSR